MGSKHRPERLRELTHPAAGAYLPGTSPVTLPAPKYLCFMDLNSGGVAEAARRSVVAPEWVVFRCAGGAFGVPIRSVKEIIRPRPYTRLPGCGAEVCGLIGLRGRVITVFDFAAAEGLPALDRDQDHRILIIEYGNRLAGFAAQSIAGVATGRVGELAVSAESLRGFDVDREELVGIGELRTEPFVAVDPRRVLERLLG